MPATTKWHVNILLAKWPPTVNFRSPGGFLGHPCDSFGRLNWGLQFFSYIIAKTSYNLIRWWWCSHGTSPTCLVQFLQRMKQIMYGFLF
jgi:hypothetical protein